MIEAVDRYDSLIEYYSQGTRFDALQIKAQIYQESLMNPRAKSSANAKGLAQAMGPTWREFCNGQDPFNPEASIEFCCRYMEWISDYLSEKFPIPSTSDPEEHWRRCCAAYNWGIGNISKHSDRWEDELPEETRTYLERIAGYFSDFMEE